MADNTVPITAGSGTSIRTVTNAGADSGAHQQVVSLADLNGNFLPQDPDLTPQISGDAKALFFDAFDVSLANFTLSSGTSPSHAPTWAAGAASVSPTVTTASNYSYLRSNYTFALRPQAYLRVGFFVQLESAAVTNNTRWWGYGTNQTTPTAASPILNGAIFQIDYVAGALYGAIFSNGTRTQTTTLTRPSDGGLHKYEIWFRQSIVYFLIDSVTVGSISLPNINVTSGQYLIAGSANFTTSSSATPVLSLSSASMSDTSGTVHTLGDGIFPTIQASVKQASTAAATTDQPLVVALHPSSTTPALAAGGSLVGAVAIGATTPSSTFYTSTTTNAATVSKTSAGNLQVLLISNTSASTQYVKLFNATAVTLGTTVAVVDIPIATLTTLSLPLGPNGLRMTTGIAFTVTGASGATNNTAGAGGVYIALTYV